MNTWLIILFNSIVLFFLTLIITKYIKKKTLSRATPFDFISYAVIAIIISLISLNIVLGKYEFPLRVLVGYVYESPPVDRLVTVLPGIISKLLTSIQAAVKLL